MVEQSPAADSDIRLTGGFVLFVGAMVLPALIALAVFLGAWAVSEEVYAAELAATEARPAVTDSGDREVASWKRSLVGICPIH